MTMITELLLAELDREMVGTRRALERVSSTTDERLLNSRWQLLMQGNVLSSDTRYEAIRIGVLNHLYHHRAQVTTYLRLNQKPVPAL